MESETQLTEEKKIPAFESSGWSAAIKGLGGLSFICALVFLIISQDTYSRSEREFFYILMACGIGGGIGCFFQAFLVDKLSEVAFYSKLQAEYLFKSTHTHKSKEKDTQQIP